jgi:hypothetical protein
MKNPIRAWLVKWHGEGEEYQHDFYRCDGCKKLISWKKIRAGGCRCGSYRMRPAFATLFEKVKILVTPWLIT